MKYKILLAGDWHSDLHEEAVRRALMQLGQDVVCFPWHQYFKPNQKLEEILTPILKFQNKYLVGPKLKNLNEDLVKIFRECKPDVVFIYRGTHIFPETLAKLKKIRPNSVLVGYNNDDPFAPSQPKWLWRHFLACLPLYDIALAYRNHNLEDFRRAGAKRVKLLRSWFVPTINRPVNLNEREKDEYGCDVVFVGHFENDFRLACLEAVVNEGWNLRLYGHDYGWRKPLSSSRTLRHLLPVKTVWGENYNRAICGAKIALCFLSKLNRDSYTRRCFEIPAAGALLMSEYSQDLANMFEEGKEADFFKSPKEMVEKIDSYLRDDRRRTMVAEAGRARVHSDGHDVVSRMRQLTSWISQLAGSGQHEA